MEQKQTHLNSRKRAQVVKSAAVWRGQRKGRRRHRQCTHEQYVGRQAWLLERYTVQSTTAS